MDEYKTNTGEDLNSSIQKSSSYLNNLSNIKKPNIKNLANNLKSIKSLTPFGTGQVAGGAGASGAAAGAGATGAAAGSGTVALSPVLIVIGVVLLIAILLILIMPDGYMNQDDEVRDKSSYNTAFERATQKTKEAIAPKYEVVLKEADKKINKYLEDNYGEYKEYITLSVISDDIDVVSRNVTGYIQAVNGVLQNWLPRDNEDNYSPGYDLSTGDITKESEYNTIGEVYKNVVSDFAENGFFYIGEVVENIYDKEIKVPILDKDGVHLKNLLTGEFLYDKKIVKAGTLYLDVGYNVSEYKTSDIDKAVAYLNKDYFDNQAEESVTGPLIYDAIYEMLYTLTGSYEIPAPHTDRYTYLMRGEDLGYSGFVGEIIDLKEISKGATYARDSDEGYSIWKEVYDNAEGHYPVYKGGYRYQCTDLANFCFTMSSGLVSGGGNGYQMATNIVNKYPDKYTLSSTPAPGAVFSTWGGYGVNHVGFVTGVSGNKITFCDGNVKVNGTGGGIRWYVTMDIDKFENIWKGCVHYAVPIS